VKTTAEIFVQIGKANPQLYYNATKTSEEGSCLTLPVNEEKMQKNPPHCAEENQVFGKPHVGVKTKQMRNCQ
jgi:hypothetical protein